MDVSPAVASQFPQGMPWRLTAQQVTFGPNHHFFGYIGHVQNIPWNASGRQIVLLRSAFQDHMPSPLEAAEIVVLDTTRGYEVHLLDRSHAWNIQQGSMLYWDPLEPESRIFFNDRCLETGKVFTVLYDTARRERLTEFRFQDTPIGNSGVAQKGGHFLGINYGRLARLRPVTGYPGAFDWTTDVDAPVDDGLFLVETKTGDKQLLVSFAQLAEELNRRGVEVENVPLFLNHTLWSRDDSLIYCYVRGNFDSDHKIDVPFTIKPNGTNLTLHETFIGGHPEWGPGNRLFGAIEGRQIIYDAAARKVVGQVAASDVLPDPEGDIALSPDATWLVNGHGANGENQYVVVHLPSGQGQRIGGFSNAGWSKGDLRLDPAPAWDRTSGQFLVPALAADGTRQSFLVTRQTV